IGMAISTAAFPTLADQAARGDEALAATLRGALRLIIFLSLPAGIGLALLAKPLVVVLLQRGAFDVQSSDITAQALMFYAPALFAHCGIEICSRGFYAMGDTKTPVGFAVLSMLINLTLAALLVGPLEVRGIALALSLATSVEFFSLLLTLRSRVPDFLNESLLEGLGRMALATAMMGLVAGGSILVLHHGLNLALDVGPQALVIVLVSAAAGAGVYVLASEGLGLNEPAVLMRRLPVLQRLRR
ncbi:MAG TPA: lipid II flippase MurJ, partial [Candidatus Limnocylindria bacterium]|nr:lipid II flippase MurJ [Candidatus Limnocylindria bacterium]